MLENVQIKHRNYMSLWLSTVRYLLNFISSPLSLSIWRSHFREWERLFRGWILIKLTINFELRRTQGPFTCLSSLRSVAVMSLLCALKGKVSRSERGSLSKRGRNCLLEEEVDVPTDRTRLRPRVCQSWIISAANKKNLTVKWWAMRASVWRGKWLQDWTDPTLHQHAITITDIRPQSVSL